MEPRTTAGLFRDMRSLPREAWILFGGTFLNRFGHFVMPFLTIFLVDKGYAKSDAGWAIAAYGFGALISSACGGYLADRIGRKSTMLFSLVGSAACTLFMYFATANLWLVMLAVFLTALTAQLYGPACNALIADIIPEEKRVAAWSAYRLMINAGWAAGMAAAGFLASGWWIFLFAGDAATTLIFAIIVWFSMPQGKVTPRESAGWGLAIVHMKKNNKFLLFAAALTLLNIGMFQMGAVYSIHVTDGAGLSPKVFGWLNAINGIMVVLMEILLVGYTQRFAAARSMALGFLLLGSGMAMHAWSWTLWPLALAMIIFTLGEMLCFPFTGVWMAEVAPPDMRGRYMGAMSFITSVAQIGAPLIGILIYQKHPAGLWLGCGALAMLGAILMLRAGRAPQQA